MESSSSRFWVWTARQRIGLAVVFLLIVGWLFIVAVQNRSRVDDPHWEDGALAPQLITRIDPNTADAGQLAALPLIGPKRAEQIVQFREKKALEHPGQPVFRTLEDLTQIKGIGQATIQRLEPYLCFPRVESEAGRE